MNDPITASTRICAVYGHPIKHSASPAMQNAGIAALGLNWRYVAFDVHPDNLREAIAGAKAMRFVGLNLTVPHKLLAVQMVDVIDEAAKQWGAINTIRFEGRDGSNWRPLAELPPDVETEIRSVGFNTDADAIIRSISEDLGLELRGKRILILGAGGAGRATALRITREEPTELYVVNQRTPSKAEQIVRMLLDDVRPEDVKRVAEQLAPELASVIGRGSNPMIAARFPTGSIDLLINATSLGLKVDDPLPIQGTNFALKQTAAVYDMIYQPAETPLLREAKAAGCRTTNGLGMLLHQGAKALEIWSGKPAPIEVMRQALHRHVYGNV
jgi:shikimate dehydrogenase